MTEPVLPPPVLPALSGCFRDSAHYFPARVYFEDTDAGGVVYHANYLRFMERARSDMLRLLGIEQRKSLEAGEGVYAVARVTIDYRRPAYLDDNLLVESTVTKVRAAACTIDQRVLRGEDVLTSACVTVAFLSPAGRPRRQPAGWVALFETIAQGNDFTT